MGGEGGTLRVWEEGPRAVFEAERPDSGQGLYKAYLLGRAGRLLLGTLMPEGGRLRLRRSLAAGELERKGFWPPQGAEVRLAFAFGTQDRQSAELPAGWRRESDPARLLGDGLLRRSAGMLRCVLFRREGQGFALAAPWRSDREFPLTPLFCFASIEQLDGRDWAVFRFNARGCPVFKIGE